MAENMESLIPGHSPDPGHKLEIYIKAAWGLCGVAVSAGVLAYILNRTGFVFLPPTPSPSDYARAIAFSIACINVLCWMWFPLEDLRVLKMWVHTKKAAFPAYTSEFLSMMFTTFLLVFLVVSSTISALAFGIFGTAIYIVNIIGFAAIRRQVSKAANEAKVIYSKEASEKKRNRLLKALGIIENHWSCSPRAWTLRDAQQIRHSLLAVAFFAVASLGFAGRATAKAEFELYAYILGALTIVAAEVSIAIWRTSRDRSLHEIFEELRELHSNTK